MHGLHKLILSSNKMAVAAKQDLRWWKETTKEGFIFSDFCFKIKVLI